MIPTSGKIERCPPGYEPLCPPGRIPTWARKRILKVICYPVGHPGDHAVTMILDIILVYFSLNNMTSRSLIFLWHVSLWWHWKNWDAHKIIRYVELQKVCRSVSQFFFVMCVFVNFCALKNQVSNLFKTCNIDFSRYNTIPTHPFYSPGNISLRFSIARVIA